MIEQRSPIGEAVARLRAALEGTADALRTANLEALLRSEGNLELALRRMPNPRTLTPEERSFARDEATRALLQLQRCRRFGNVLLDTVRITFEAQGRSMGYGPREVPAMPYARRSLDTRG